MTDTAMIAVTVGRKKIDLKKFLNFIFWSMATASMSAVHMPIGTTPTTYIAVLRMAFQNKGS